MSGLVFQWPGLLALLVLVVPLGYLLAYARGRRAALIAAMGGGLSTHRRLRDYLRLAALTLLLLALARPGYAPQKHAVSRTGRDVVFALDVSQSMLAEDVAPSRLAVAKQAVRDALKTFSHERVGLVVYAGSATILCPLTYDYDFVRYMLEQTHTRSVDFGGTTVQSAVEKVVDQVFVGERAGVQDLVILTDGGDHGSQMPRVAELLAEGGVDLLLVGIGNPDAGATIPLVDAAGVRTLLRSKDALVYTQLEDASLRDLAAQSADAVYVPVGMRAFDLGQLYADYVDGREVSVFEGHEGVVVYQEAALFCIIPALLLLLLSECWGSHRRALGRAAVLAAVLCGMPDAEGVGPPPSTQFAEGVTLYRAGSFAEAEAVFSELESSSAASTLVAAELAALQLNRGLCLVELSKAESGTSASLALSYAQQAQSAFLAAKRYAPQLARSGMRVESTAAWVASLRAQIAEDEQVKDAQQATIEELLERLQALLEAQQNLRQQVADSDVNRRRPRRRRNAPPPAPIVAPADASTNAPRFVALQAALKPDAESIYTAMQQLDVQMRPPAIEGLPPIDSLLAEPVELMAKVPVAMAQAGPLLANWSSWPAARGQQGVAEQLIEEILNLLGNNGADESEGDEWSEMEDGDEYDYADEMSDSTMSSLPMEGDFSAGGEMQALPLPNYSVEDILLEEQGNLQFRQQQRASANAAKVEKDY
jgi:Ca-activated chloride channel family protein